MLSWLFHFRGTLFKEEKAQTGPTYTSSDQTHEENGSEVWEGTVHPLLLFTRLFNKTQLISSFWESCCVRRIFFKNEKKKPKKPPTTFKKSNNQKENCLLFVSTEEKLEQRSWLGARYVRITLQEMDLSASSWTQQDLAKCGVLFKIVLLLVLMLEITHTLPVLKPEAPFSQRTAHALLSRILKYTEHFFWPRVCWKNSRTLEWLWPSYGFQAWFPVKAWSPNVFELRKISVLFQTWNSLVCSFTRAIHHLHMLMWAGFQQQRSVLSCGDMLHLNCLLRAAESCMYNFSQLPLGTTGWILLEELCQMSGHCTCALVSRGHLAPTR